MLDIFITCFFVYCGDLSGNNIRNLTDIVYPGLLSMELFFLAPLLSFSRLLWLHFAFHILSGCRKKLSVNYGQTLEMGS